MKFTKAQLDIFLLLIMAATISLWIYDFIGKNVQMLEDTVILGAALLMLIYTLSKIFKPGTKTHKLAAITLLLTSVPYLCWSIFNFTFYGFNGAELPIYCYFLLACNLMYSVMSFADSSISEK